MPSIYGTKHPKDASTSLTAKIDDKYVRTQGRTLIFLVALSPGETIDDVMAIAPPRGSVSIYDPTIWISQVTPRQTSLTRCELDIEWSPKPHGTPPDPDEDPADWAAKWLGTTVEKVLRVTDKDADGATVEMTNGGLYSTPLEQIVNVMVYRYRRYYPLVAIGGGVSIEEKLLFWNNTINDDVYRGKPKWTWLLTVTASPETVNGFDVAALTFELKYNRLTWVEERLQHDAWYLAGGVKKLFRDGDGNPITGNLTVTGNDGGTARYYKKHRSYEEIDFDTLDF